MIIQLITAAWHYLTCDPNGQCLAGGLIAVVVLGGGALAAAGS